MPCIELGRAKQQVDVVGRPRHPMRRSGQPADPRIAGAAVMAQAKDFRNLPSA
jgi:hypothetical protein